MNIALLCALIIVTAETDGFHVQNERTFHKELGQRILIRKLLTSQQDDPTETKTVAWNKILANVLVSHMKTPADVETITKKETNNMDFFQNLMSQTMKFFKVFIYDRFVKPFQSNVKDSTEVLGGNTNKTIAAENDIIPSVHTEINAPTTVSRDVANSLPNGGFNFGYPKTEVEYLDSEYHGKLREKEISEPIGTVSTCPDGLVVNEDGICTNPKSKFILSIPFQCPNGYRRDWLGICRPRL